MRYNHKILRIIIIDYFIKLNKKYINILIEYKIINIELISLFHINI